MDQAHDTRARTGTFQAGSEAASLAIQFSLGGFAKHLYCLTHVTGLLSKEIPNKGAGARDYELLLVGRKGKLSCH